MSKVFGSLLVFALVMAPAATSRYISSDVRRYLSNTIILTISLGLFGLFLSIFLDLPTSGIIAGLTSGAYIFGIVYFKLKKK